MKIKCDFWIKFSWGLLGILLLKCFENAAWLTQILLFLPFYVVFAYPVLIRSLQDYKQHRFLRESFLMLVATLGASILGEWMEALAVLLFYALGEFLEEKASWHSQKKLEHLLSLRSESARVLENGEEKVLPIQNVASGSILLIQPFEKIPLDCVILEGESWIDSSFLTGESEPVFVQPRDEILAGSFNGEKTLKAQVLRIAAESSVEKIVQLVRHAREKKAKMEKWISQFASFYTPIVVFCALCLAIFQPLLSDVSWQQSFFRALVLLVVSCPCAFMIGVPLVYFCAIGRASKEGIIIKGGVFVDVLAHVKKILFDKTGTLTKGCFTVRKLAISAAVFQSLGKDSFRTIFQSVAMAEKGIHHPIAQSLVNFYTQFYHEQVPNLDKEQKRGQGVWVPEEKILCGSLAFLQENGVHFDENTFHFFALEKGEWVEIEKEEWTHFNVFLAQNGRCLAAFSSSDEEKESAADFIAFAHQNGIKTAILSGDSFSRVQDLAQKLNIHDFYAALMPDEKVALFQKMKGKSCAIFVGDGANDAPVLASADAGIAWGKKASAIALENADVVLMNDSFEGLKNTMVLARRTKNILWQNVVLALGVKFLSLILGALGFFTMWLAIFADTGVTLLVVLNALRIFNLSLRA